MRQQIFDRYFPAAARRAGLDARQEGIVAFAIDLALEDLEAGYAAVSACDADVYEKSVAVQSADITMLSEKLVEAELSNGQLTDKLHDAQQALATMTDERNRLKRQLADLENTIEHVREAEMLRTTTVTPNPVVLPPSVVGVAYAGTVNGNGHSHTIPRVTVEKPTRIDFAGTNVELRDLVFAAFQLFHQQNGRAPSHADWKHIRVTTELPSANTIEKRLGMTWANVAKAAGLEPNAKFNARSEDKADNAEATFPS